MLDLTKPLQTRDGRKARYLGELSKGTCNFPSLVFAVERANGIESVTHRYAYGLFSSNSSLTSFDIVNVPPPPVVTREYRNVYSAGSMSYTRYKTLLAAGDGCDINKTLMGVLCTTLTDGVVSDVLYEKVK